MNSNRRIKIIMKTMAVLAAGILISIAFLANADTYSWFIGAARNCVSVSAAETEDIIESIEVIYKDMDPYTGEEYNPIAIKLKKAQSFKLDPLIFFSVEGEAAEYILQINPVRLYSNAYYIIPIETNINVNQHVKLYSRTGRIEGTLRIKYMNEFIDESKDISFAKDFLVDRLMAAIIRGDVQEEESQTKFAMMRFTTLVETPEYTAGMQKNGRTGSRAIENVAIKAIVSLAELVEWKGIDIVSEDREISDEALLSMELKLTSDQEFLMDIMYPGLKRYMEGLKGYIDKLRAEIKDKNAQLTDLDEKLANLESQYDRLLEENARLTEQINTMILSPPPVQPIANQPASDPEVQSPGTALPPSAGDGSSGGGSCTADGSIPDGSQDEDYGNMDEEPGTDETSPDGGTIGPGNTIEEPGTGETPDEGSADSGGEVGVEDSGDGNNTVESADSAQGDVESGGSDEKAEADNTRGDSGDTTDEGKNDGSGGTEGGSEENIDSAGGE